MRTRIALVGLAFVVSAAATAYYYFSVQRSPEFVLVGYDFLFIASDGPPNPDLAVKLGDSVKMTLTNRGRVEHELVIITPSEFQRIVGSWKAGERTTGISVEIEPVFPGARIEPIGQGQTKSVTFVADKAGEYVYACFVTLPDLHAILGMWGKFQVR